MTQLLIWAVWQPEFNSLSNHASTVMMMAYLSVYGGLMVAYREGRFR